MSETNGNLLVSIEASCWSAVKRWFKSTSGIAFVSVFIVGLAAHLYVYTNLYLAHDAAFLHNYDPAWDTLTGRFFGTAVKQALHGSLQLPLLIGFISLILLGLSSVCVCKTLRIQKPVYIVLTSACIVTWPTITSINCYIYMASQFCVAIFAACLAAYIADRFRLGFVFAIPLIIVSMACYQAYWGTAAALMLLVIIGDILENRTPAAKLWQKALRFLIALGISLGVYYGLWRFLAGGMDMPVYLGMDALGYGSLGEFFIALKDTYYYVYAFFLRPNVYSYYPIYLFVAVLLGMAVAVFLGVRMIIIRRIYRQRAKCLLLALSLVLLPVAMNCATLFSGGAETNSLLTRFAFLSPLLVLVMLLSQISTDNSIIPSPKLHAAVFFVSAAVLLSSCLNGFFGANATYVRQESGYHMALSHVTQYLNRIQAEPGYRADTPVLLVGEPGPVERGGFGWTEHVTGVTPNVLSYKNVVHEYFSLLGPSCILFKGDSKPYLAAPAVQALEAFPSNDCVAWVDGVLVFKLS